MAPPVITPGVTVSPDVNLFDMDEYDRARNQAYCREIEAQMLAAELDPRNFFRLKGKRSYNLNHGTPYSSPVRSGGVRALR